MQLSMRVAAETVRTLPGPRVPDGYVLRGYHPGDEDGWVDLLILGGFTEWTRERMDSFLAVTERREGSSIVEWEGRVVAATFASWQALPSRAGILDYVVSHPDHRGRGLGRAVCTAVLKFHESRGYESMILQTDDCRLPAIHVYLALGFEPEITREDMPARWEAIKKLLDAHGG